MVWVLLFIQINFLSVQVYLVQQSHLVVFYIRSSFVFWLLGETSEEQEGETEEPETSTQEQVRIDWACIWMEEGGLPAVVESESQSLLMLRYFSF